MAKQKFSTDIQEFLERDTTQIFLTAARKIVELLEIENINKEDFFKRAHTALIDLYASGHRLEEIDLEFQKEDADFKKNIFVEDKNIHQIADFGHEAKYWKVFNPINKNMHESMQGDLALDFDDIYYDLKAELEKMKIGTNEAVEDALWQMKFSFTMHWGNHCIDALRALHYLSQDEKLLE